MVGLERDLGALQAARAGHATREGLAPSARTRDGELVAPAQERFGRQRSRTNDVQPMRIGLDPVAPARAEHDRRREPLGQERREHGARGVAANAPAVGRHGRRLEVLPHAALADDAHEGARRTQRVTLELEYDGRSLDRHRERERGRLRVGQVEREAAFGGRTSFPARATGHELRYQAQEAEHRRSGHARQRRDSVLHGDLRFAHRNRNADLRSFASVRALPGTLNHGVCGRSGSSVAMRARQR
jgi:hypothetical protein